MEENTRQIQNQEEYDRRWSEMSVECTEAKNLMAKIKDDILKRTARKENIRRYLDELKQSGDILTEFDETLWQATVDKVTVHADKSMTVTFRDGTEIPVKPAEPN
jgi:seryl-tRNA synthetase